MLKGIKRSLRDWLKSILQRT